MTLLSLVDKKDDVKERDKKRILGEIEKWFLREDVDEVLILGKCTSGDLRSQAPLDLTGRIWWIGALEIKKAEICQLINDETEIPEEPDEEGGNEDE